MNLIRRGALLTRLTGSAGHVLLAGPSGYGKSVLLDQLRVAVPGSAFLTARAEDTFHSLCGRAGDAALLLIDDAHLLPEEEVAALLRLPHEQLRVVLAARHLHYPRVQLLLQRRQLTVLSALELAFTVDELQMLDGGNGSHDLMTRTLGWPALVGTILSATGSSAGYLDDLLDELSPGERDWLLDIAHEDAWDTALLVAERDGLFRSLAQRGFPLISMGGHPAVHPAMRLHLQERVGLGPARLPERDSALQSLLELAPRTPPGTLVRLIGGYFERHGEDDSQIALKIQLLSAPPLADLPPTLRDMYAGYLITFGEHQRAEHVLLKQQEWGTDSARTHVLLANIASVANHLDIWAQRLDMAHSKARTDGDFARYYGSMSYLAVRRNEYDLAEEYAQRHLEYATRSRNLAKHYAALTNVAYVRQMKGNLLGAMDMTLQGLALAEQEGDRYLPQVKYLMFQLSEVLKDNGEFDRALDLIRRALEIQIDSKYAVPFLYNTRGLIQMEFGQFEEALLNFSAATDLFQERGPIVGLLMSHTYAAYALHRLGWKERVTEHLTALRELVHRVASDRSNYDEPQAYLPLVEGLALLGRGDRLGALAAFETVALEGRLTYDSVLLTVLMAAKLRVQLGRYGPGDAERLVRILDARGNSVDITAQMYRDEFGEVYRACMVLGVQVERFAQILAIPAPALPVRSGYRVHLVTFGKVSLSVNDRPTDTSAYYPLYALTYLHLRSDWRTADEMGDELYTQMHDGRRPAIKSMSMLRQLLRTLDPELEAALLSPKNDPRGYRIERGPQASVTADVDTYLSEAFTPANPDLTELRALLGSVGVFLAGVPESRFVQCVNRTLEDRAAAAALHLAAHDLQAGEPGEAARALLLSLRLAPTPEVVNALRETVPLLRAQAQGVVTGVISTAQEDSDLSLGVLIAEALTAV